MKFIQFRIGDIVQMKKKHPCGSQEWEVLQLGSVAAAISSSFPAPNS